MPKELQKNSLKIITGLKASYLINTTLKVAK